MQPDFRININFVPKLHLFSLLLIVALKKEMSMEQWRNDTDRGRLKYWEKNIIQREW